MRIVDVRADARFVGPTDRPRQVVEVTLQADGPVRVGLDGRHARAAPVVAGPGAAGWGRASVELAVVVAAGTVPGTRLPVEVWADGDDGSRDRCPVELVVARPGTTVHLVPHFHFDAVWWNTQAASVSELAQHDWSGSPRLPFQRSAFEVLRDHLHRAHADPAYRFCVAEVDYLRPFLDRHPWERASVAALLAEGRLEVVGGTFNEPATNLTGLELTRRNLVHGLAFQEGVLGARIATAWQLDVFGHHPAFPSLLADAGIGASVWARGPFHQWGPMIDGGFDRPHAATGMSFPSEFEWLAPDGDGVLTAYLAAHYSPAYALDGAGTWEEAAALAVDLGAKLREVSLTDHVLLLVGTDLSPPPRWVTELPERFAERYAWPRLECSLPSRFVAGVRADLARSGHRPPPISRDMNPVYTGKDVSYIDTKQAARGAEDLLGEAETWATLADLLGAGTFPEADVDHAWRLLVYGAHHDAITGTESDQVYLDLLAGWRRAHDLAAQVVEGAQTGLAARTDTRGPGLAILVFDGAGVGAPDVVAVRLGQAELAYLTDPVAGAVQGLRLLDAGGAEVPFVAEHPVWDAAGCLDAVTVRFVAEAAAGIGTRAYHLVAGDDLPTWRSSGVTAPVQVGNDVHGLTVDPARGGCVTAWRHHPSGRDLVPPGDVGAELLLYPEHPTHPTHGEGPWHLSPSGPPERSSSAPAVVRVERSPVGERVVVDGRVGGLGHRTTLTLWAGVDRIDAAVDVRHDAGQDHLLRARWPAAVPGGLPVVDVGEAVIGRGFALIDVDAAEHPWTLDTPAHGWFARSSTARVSLRTGDGEHLGDRAIGVAEIVVANPEPGGLDAGHRRLVVALARAGVTATCTPATGARHGTLAHDSNLPDVRISVGLAGANTFTAAVLDANPAERDLVAHQLATTGRATVWVPAARSLRETWCPSADLREHGALPVLVVVATSPTELDAVTTGLVEGLTEATVPAAAVPGRAPDPDRLDDATVAVLERGTPGCAVAPDGSLHISLLRACSAWPSGQWIDPPRRSAPDSTSFQLQHWSHRFEHALVAGDGDWRSAGVAGHARAYRRPRRALVERPHPGPLAPGPLVSVSPPTAELIALKPAGYPLVAGRPADDRRPGRVVARLHETHGRATTVHVAMPGQVHAAVRSDLTETASRGALPNDGATVTVELAPAGTTTAVVDLALPHPPTTTTGADGGRPAGPQFSRYWVQNRGPAPAGGMPVTVHLHPPSGNGPQIGWAVSVTSDLREPVRVRLVHDAPPGWAVDAEADEVVIAPGGHRVLELTVTAARPLGDGPHVVRTTAHVDGAPHLAVYDEHVLLDATTPGGTAILLTGPDDGIHLPPGARGELTVALANLTAVGRQADLELLSPWGTWPLFPDPVRHVHLAPHAELAVAFPVVAAEDAPPGTWWALVRALAGPEVVYSRSVSVVVGPS